MDEQFPPDHRNDAILRAPSHMARMLKNRTPHGLYHITRDELEALMHMNEFEDTHDAPHSIRVHKVQFHLQCVLLYRMMYRSARRDLKWFLTCTFLCVCKPSTMCTLHAQFPYFGTIPITHVILPNFESFSHHSSGARLSSRSYTLQLGTSS